MVPPTVRYKSEEPEKLLKKKHQHEQLREMRDEDDHGGPDDEDGLLGQNAGGAAPGYCACLSVAYYRPYFDVDTDEVAARLRAALFFCNEPFGATLRGKPDAYGPWWVATTLVFAVAVTSHVRGLLGAEAGVIYEFDFSAVTFAAATIYGYVALAAATNWAFLNYGLKVHQRPLACLCVVGYSLVPYLAAAPACALPYLAWPAVLAACAAQSLFALKAARPAVEPHPREKVLAFAGATCALNAGLALLLKVYLY